MTFGLKRRNCIGGVWDISPTICAGQVKILGHIQVQTLAEAMARITHIHHCLSSLFERFFVIASRYFL
jgi:hypothetical protein